MSVQTDLRIVEDWYNLHINEKLSHVDIAKKYNVNRETVRRNFKRFNLKSYNYHNMIKHNPDKFSSIETEEDAYWLGFIYADGYVSDSNNFEISLQKADVNHLEKLRLYLELSTKVSVDSFRCRLIYKNKIFVDNLKNLGVIPRKSLILTFPYNKISNELIRHFIRGYFDGDGCISTYNKQKVTMISKILSVSLLGTKDFLDGIREYSPISFGKYIKNNGSENTLVLSTAHKKGFIFINWLYQNSTIYLDRKYNKYLEYCRYKEKSL